MFTFQRFHRIIFNYHTLSLPTSAARRKGMLCWWSCMLKYSTYCLCITNDIYLWYHQYTFPLTCTSRSRSDNCIIINTVVSRARAGPRGCLEILILCPTWVLTWDIPYRGILSWEKTFMYFMVSSITLGITCKSFSAKFWAYYTHLYDKLS